MEFNPSRLVLARKRRGLSKTTLAQQSRISVRSLTYYESKSSPVTPSTEHLNVLAEKLEFPAEFFFGPDIELLDCDAASFRALTKMTASQRDTALAAGSIAKCLCDWIEHRFELPGPKLPSLRELDPEAAAHVLRTEWGLGERPLPNTVHLLESRGVRVFSLPVDSRRVDAFSLWHKGTPFVFLNTKESAEHARFDAAHELGHLTMHTHGTPRSREVETEADKFASSFLMPRGDVYGHVPPPRTITVNVIHSLKKRWGVSAFALAYRLHKLEIITDWQYRSLCVQLSRTGYKTGETDGTPRDTSQLLAKVFTALRAEGVTRGAIARDLSLPLAEIESYLVGLVVAAVVSSKPDGGQIPTVPLRTGRPDIKAV
jgi:Zn-dependent peptidase ImmA (M78 family)